jgi:nitroreductase
VATDESSERERGAAAGVEAFLELARRRRSVRRFEARGVPGPLVDRLLEAASLAPSAGNRQPYRLIVASARATIEAMERAVVEAVRAIVEGARPDRAADLEAYTRSFLVFADAPLLFAPIHRAGVDPLGAALAASGLEAISSVSAAIMSLLLAAEACGLGACWMTGPLVAAPALRAILEVPEGWDLSALVPVGYPAERPPAPPRRPLARLVRFIE